MKMDSESGGYGVNEGISISCWGKGTNGGKNDNFYEGTCTSL